MALEVPIRILLPIIIRLFPELVDAPLVRGLIIPLKTVDAENDAELARNLARRPKFKRPKAKRDETQAIVLDQAIKCVEDQINDPALSAKGLITLAHQLLDQSSGASPIGDRIIKCLRENALRQDTPRVKRTKTYWKRPSK